MSAPHPWWSILEGDARRRLLELPTASVHCVVTSPPYWGLRDYGHEGQVGREPTHLAYVRELVGIFEEVGRVLRPDGTLWLNLGDSYVANAASAPRAHGFMRERARGPNGSAAPAYAANAVGARGAGLKSKDLVGIPWRVALALQDAGWWLRQDNVWAKPNPMPESVKDRSTTAHEYVFHLARGERYFYDADAVAEPAVGETSRNGFAGRQGGSERVGDRSGGEGSAEPWPGSSTRNRRSVWTIPVRPYSEAHFATFPWELPDLCIRAGTSEVGACPSCGAQWERVRERREPPEDTGASLGVAPDRDDYGIREKDPTGGGGNRLARVTRGSDNWTPGCDCPPDPPVPPVVLDPFAGAGTTGLVALRRGRSFVGVELNPEYSRLAWARLWDDAPLWNPLWEARSPADFLQAAP